MPSGLFRVVGLCLLGWLMSHTAAAAQGTGQSAPYDFQSPLVRELKGGEKHSYPIPLKANDYVKVVVEQKGIDVAVRLVGPDGKVTQEVDSPNGTQGPEPLASIVEQAGTYTLEIESPEPTAPSGTYELKPGQIRPATEQDRAEVKIQALNAEVEKLKQAGKLSQGVPLAQQAVELSEKIFGVEHPLLAESLTKLGELYMGQGDYAKAEPPYQRALTIREKGLKPDHSDVAESLNNLALLYHAKGDYAKAEPLFQRALAIDEKMLGAEHQFVAADLNNLAILYWSKGDYAASEPLYRRSLAISEKVLGADHPDVANSLNSLAGLYLTQGDYAKAEPLIQRALAIYEKTMGADDPLTASALNSLAFIYRKKGDFAKAEPLYRRALANMEKALGPDHPDVGRVLNNLAWLSMEKNDYSQAELLYQRVLAIYEKRLGPDHPETATSLNNLAVVYQGKGDSAKAEALRQRVLAIREKALGANHPLTAQSLHNLAGQYRARGDYAKAEPLYLRALAIYEKTFGKDHPETSTNLNSLALLYQATGDLTQGIQFRIRCNHTTERDLMRNLVTGSESQKALYLKQTGKRTDQTLSLHLQAAPQSRAAQEAALTVILRRKGRSLDAMTSAIETLRRRQTPETQKLLDEYARLAGQISVLTLRGPGKKNPAEHLAALQELEVQKDKLEAEISQRSGEFKAQVTPITVEGVQQEIPPEAALVEYAVYQPFDVKTQKFGTPRYAVYVLNQRGEIRFADLGETTPIDQAVTVLRTCLSNRANSLEKAVKPAAQTLDKLVLKPVRALVGKSTHLFVSPDGALNLIPFAALVDEEGKFLVEQYTLTYLTSGRDLLRLGLKSASQDPPLVLADPDYAAGKGPELLGHAFKALRRLTGTHLEGTQIKAVLPDASLRMEAEATEAALKQVRRPALLHIATHGFFLADDTKQTPAGDETRQLEREQENPPVNVEALRQSNPLLRSVLFFAGANQGGSADNDGVMTALEAAQLDLWGTKLVTLSACDTALGDVKNGDGVYGLRRALVLAGSEAQMMSLWPVSDQGTRELMIAYYTRLKAGEGRSEALRNVQLRLLKDPKRQHPYYWASFIQSGEWANLAGQRQ
ncbi:MAG: CHAT domain-containing protein [Blastocatellia bacterium]|nr:CHAT domain-containing protein [Blastocatellia bacterium]